MAAAVTVNQRFATLIQVLNLTKSGFAQSLDKTPSVVQHLIDGRNKPGYDLLYKVFEVYPNVSRDWLILGKGPMLLGSAAPGPVPTNPGPGTAPELPLGPPAATASAPAPPSPPAGLPAETSAPVGSPEAPMLPPAPPETPRQPLPRTPADAPLRAVDIAAVLAASAKASRPAAAPEETPADAPPALPAPAPASAAPAEAFVAATLHTQHLQHQLALAELRNQHLLEQQALLREMLALTRRRSKRE